jgi:putative phosphoribosyl transferase
MFRDRVDAGRQLAEELKQRHGHEDVVVLGLPRGGVPVAFEVAQELDAPLDVIVVRKLGVPYQPELGMGAIGEDGVRVLNDEVLAMARVGEDEVAAVERSERAELERRAVRFRGDRPSSVGPRSWSTTASPRGRRPEPPARSHGPTARPG